MKFIIDAQLPKLLAQWLRDRGYDAIHTLELPDKNRTGDDMINQISLQEQRIVISKDSDFYHRYFRQLEPHKLIYLTTGNISNADLLTLFDKNLERIITTIEYSSVIEITRTKIITID
jgi:predicted nuclease of predicted toxin-antitoxin system